MDPKLLHPDFRDQADEIEGLEDPKPGEELSLQEEFILEQLEKVALKQPKSPTYPKVFLDL